jgi:hypothetical protein
MAVPQEVENMAGRAAKECYFLKLGTRVTQEGGGGTTWYLGGVRQWAPGSHTCSSPETCIPWRFAWKCRQLMRRSKGGCAAVHLLPPAMSAPETLMAEGGHCGEGLPASNPEQGLTCKAWVVAVMRWRSWEAQPRPGEGCSESPTP